MKKITKPKINDYVEMIDMSKMFGFVKTIISNNELEIEWSDKI